MKNIFRLLILLTVTIFIVSCAGPYTIEDSGSTINLSNDATFEIELNGNASTGYSWQIIPFDSTVIKKIGEPVYKANNEGEGSAGMYTFKFQAIADGQVDLLLVYRRKWEEHKQPAKMFKMKIVVGTMGRILED